eukprot:3540050-Prymnesium_polylepis.4
MFIAGGSFGARAEHSEEAGAERCGRGPLHGDGVVLAWSFEYSAHVTEFASLVVQGRDRPAELTFSNDAHRACGHAQTSFGEMR